MRDSDIIIFNGFIHVLGSYNSVDTYLKIQNIDYSQYVFPTRIRHLLRDCLPVEILSTLHLYNCAIDGVLKLNETPEIPEMLDEAAFRTRNPKLILQSSGGWHIVHVHANLIGDIIR